MATCMCTGNCRKYGSCYGSPKENNSCSNLNLHPMNYNQFYAVDIELKEVNLIEILKEQK